MSDLLWGVDLGGTKIEGVVLDKANLAEPLLRRRLPTEAGKGYQHIIQQISRLVDSMQKEIGMKANRVGFGTPGILDQETNTMKNCNSTALNGQPLQRDLEDALQLPVLLSNDANCFALAEYHQGVVKKRYPQTRVLMGLILGTGVGGGIVIDGKVWEGCHGIAGEWGHNFLDQSGGKCYCGKIGCVERIISGSALEKFYAQSTGSHRSMKEIAAMQEADTAAEATVLRLITYFGKAIAEVINILDPEVIVIGGGVGQVKQLYTSSEKAIMPHLFNNRLATKICRPMLGDSAGVFGAAWLSN